MAPNLIVPDELPTWVPGQLTVQSPGEGWQGVSVRGYRYAGSDVHVPPMRDYMIVAYRRGVTAMRRRIDGRWSTESLGPGDVSLLTRAAESDWVWPEGIEVVHVYLTQEELATTCRQMYEREIADIELEDVLKANDPAIHRVAMHIAAEAAHSDIGSPILIESLSCQLSVHILRRHAQVRFREQPADDALSPQQTRTVQDFIRAHLHESISLDDLARCVALSRYHFARRFRRTMGATPHEFVLGQRISRARLMLRRTRTPLREIASLCGFSDQSHMTRVFQQRLGITPGRYRAEH
jgi:AraC family transcriptional regulator